MQKLLEFLEHEVEARGVSGVDNYINQARDALNEAHALEALLHKCARLLSVGVVRDEVLASLGEKDTRHVG
jgi:hypothetical protein